MNKDIDSGVWRATWLAVSQLRGGLEVDECGLLFIAGPANRLILRVMHCVTWDTARATALQHMLYTQCALLDESVLNRNRQDSGYITWLWRHPYRRAYFNTTNAGEDLLAAHIRTVLREPVPDTAVLTCFYRAITLVLWVAIVSRVMNVVKMFLKKRCATQAMPF